MQELLDGGLTDLGDGTGHTVPTAINADHMHFAKLRLDYALANARMLEGCGGKGASSGKGRAVRAAILRDKRATELSDHFPLDLAFEVPELEAAAHAHGRHGHGHG